MSAALTPTGQFIAIVDAFVQVVPNQNGPAIDNSSITQDSGQIAYRQRMNLSDPSQPDAHTSVLNRDPLSTEFGPITRDPYGPAIVNLLQQLLNAIQEFQQVFYGKL